MARKPLSVGLSTQWSLTFLINRCDTGAAESKTFSVLMVQHLCLEGYGLT